MNVHESESFNPYAAPQIGPEVADPFEQDDTRIRQQFIDCEANLKTIAGLLVLGGVILAGSCVIPGFLFLAQQGLDGLGAAAIIGVPAILGIVQFVVGLQVRSFRPSARIGAIVLCSLWLLFIPFGTMIGGACLWYLARPAAKYVFTQEYCDIIQRTPHVEFRTSRASWGILIAVLLGILGLIVVSNL